MDEDNFNEEPEEDTVTINFLPTYVILVIDTHSSMFITRNNIDDIETHPFKDALTACYEIADSLVLSKKTKYNQFGIVLATEDSKANFIEIQNNMLETTNFLKEKCNVSNEELMKTYQRNSTNDFDLGALFLLCKRKFQDIKSKYYKRTLIFITNDDDPVKGNSQKRFTALNEAKTFEACDINFAVFSMRTDFNYDIFYDELFGLFSKPPTLDLICEDKDGLREKLIPLIVYRYIRLRSKFFPFKNDYQRFLSVMRVNFIQNKKFLLSTASVDGKILKLVHIEEDPSNKNEIRDKYALQFGLNKEIFISLKERMDFTANDFPLGYHLQYICDRQLDEGVAINKPGILIVDPKEELTYFDQFWQYCVDRNKVMVCIKKVTSNSSLTYVQLVPKFANDQKMFIVKQLAFCNEYVIPEMSPNIKQEKESISDNSKIDLVRNFIERLSFKFDPSICINLANEKKKANIKSKLLEAPEEEVDDVFDYFFQACKVNNADIFKRVKAEYFSQNDIIKRQYPTEASSNKPLAKRVRF